MPHLQTTVALWTLRLESELVFAGDAGTTEVSRPSRRYGVEWANYYSPRPWLMFDGDVAWSRGRFTDFDPVGDRIPGSVQTVVSLGATLDSVHGVFGSARLRYFGPRPLIENGSVQSNATSLVNLETGYKVAKITSPPRRRIFLHALSSSCRSGSPQLARLSDGRGLARR